MGGAEGKSEISAIPNKYKDSLDDLIDSSDIEFPDWSDSPDYPRLIDKRLRNAPGSRDTLLTLLEEDRLDENVLFISLEPTDKICASQIYQRNDVILLDVKSGRA